MEVAKGKMTRKELVNVLVRELFITTGAMSLGTLTQELIPIPVFGFMVGSIVGSILGTFIYDKGYSVFMSFFVESGFTLFGLADQNYELPNSILNDMGIDTFEYDKIVSCVNDSYDKFETEKFSYDTFEPDYFSIKFLRRGVIGISKIGYAA